MKRLFWLLLTTTACEPSGKSDGDDGTTATTDTTDSGTADDTDTPDGPPVGEGCRATPRDADADRTVLVNLSFDGSGDGWAVLTLAADGTLTDTGETVTGGRTYLNPGVFTPDGSLGVVALDDGSLTIFSVDDVGGVEVVEAGWTSGFYAGAVGMDASGERLYVADQNTVDNGGGLYVIDLDCETGLPSVPTDLPVDAAGWLVPGRLPATVLPLPGRFDRVAMVGGVDGNDLTLVDSTTGDVLDAIDVFGDDASLAFGAVTPAAELILLTDISAWSDEDNSIAAVAIDGDTLTAAGRTDLFDGVGLAVGPLGTTAVVSSGYADDILRLGLDATSAAAVSVAGSLSTSGGSPQLPGGMVTVQRGSLAGHTLVAEVTGLRSVMIGIDGEALDLGVTGGRVGNPAGILVQP